MKGDFDEKRGGKKADGKKEEKQGLILLSFGHP